MVVLKLNLAYLRPSEFKALYCCILWYFVHRDKMLFRPNFC